MAQSRHKSEIERDRRNIAKLYLSGTTQMDIAEKLKISQATVSRDLKVIEKEWSAARINDIDERKRMELAKIDNLELVYWEGWKKSQADAEVETVKMQGNADKPGKVGPDIKGWKDNFKNRKRKLQRKGAKVLLKKINRKQRTKKEEKILTAKNTK